MKVLADPSAPAREFFYLKDRLKQDAALHEPILAEGDTKTAYEVSRKVAKRLGLTEAQIDALMKPRLLGKEYDEAKHPRGEHGHWTDAGGGEASGQDALVASADYSSLRTMPKEIEGVSISKQALSGGQLAVGGSNGIAVSTSRKAAAAWKDMAAYQKNAFEVGWSSSPHPNHVIWHELAHVKVKNESSIDHDSYLKNLHGLFNSHFKAIAAKVSKYAGTNGHEFIAEVFAATRAGRKLDDDVMAYYKFLKGPTP